MSFKWSDIAQHLGFYAGFSENNLEEFVDFVAEQKIGWVELDLTHPDRFPDRMSAGLIKELKKRLKKYNLRLGLRAPADLDFLSPHHNVHQAVMSRMIEFFEMAAEMNATSMTISLPPLLTFPYPEGQVSLTRLQPEFVEETLSRTLHLLYAFSDDIAISVVNTAGQWADPLVSKCLNESLKKEELGLSLDTGALFHTRQVELPYLQANRSHLRKIYLHDADSAVDHLVIGQGDIQFLPLLDLLAGRKLCPIILKARSRADLLAGLAAFRQQFCN